MNLRNATSLLLVGLSYIGVRKVVTGLASTPGNSGVIAAGASLLWFIAALSIALFAYQFLVEVKPRSAGLRYSVSAILFFTGLVILSRLPLRFGPETWATQRLLFDVFRSFNSVAVVAACFSLLRLVPGRSRLRTALQWSAYSCGFSAAVKLISTGLYLKFFVAGEEAGVWPIFPILSAGVALVAFLSVSWFLVLFRQVDDYSVFGRNVGSFAA